MIKTKKQMFTVIGVFALVMLLGEITYAFFNYTRTGLANTITTGQIHFNTTQTSGENGYINLSNVFPIDPTETGIMDDTTKVGTVTINVTGDTNYGEGIEYIVTAANVTNTVGTKQIPISISVTATSGLGTSDEDYYTNRGVNANSSIYKVLAEDTISSNSDILVGYIKSGANGVNGNIVIKAYLDENKILISDTYYGNVTATPTPTAPTDEYGTPESMAEGKVILTTTEWNSLQSSGISFQVKVEAREGTWVDEPIIYTDINCFTTTVNNNEVTITGYDVSCGGTDVVIPSTINGNNVKKIGEGAFFNKSLTSVIFPQYLTEIGSGAFANNSFSGELVIPSSVTSIGEYSFNRNSIGGFTSIVIPNSVTSISITAFGNNAITSVNIDMPIIPDNMFNASSGGSGTSSIEHVIFGEHVTTIGSNAFTGNHIENVTIPSNVQTLKCNAFAGQQYGIVATNITYEQPGFVCTN